MGDNAVSFSVLCRLKSHTYYLSTPSPFLIPFYSLLRICRGSLALYWSTIMSTTIEFAMQLDMTVIASDSHLIVGVSNLYDARRVFNALSAANIVDDGCLVVKHDVEDGNPYEVIATAEDLFA